MELYRFGFHRNKQSRTISNTGYHGASQLRGVLCHLWRVAGMRWSGVQGWGVQHYKRQSGIDTICAHAGDRSELQSNVTCRHRYTGLYTHYLTLCASKLSRSENNLGKPNYEAFSAILLVFVCTCSNVLMKYTFNIRATSIHTNDYTSSNPQTINCMWTRPAVLWNEMQLSWMFSLAAFTSVTCTQRLRARFSNGLRTAND